MNPKSFDNQDREYWALLIERNPKDYMEVSRRWVLPDRVYKGGRGRHQIEFTDGGKKVIRENWPGASTFELYKRIP